MILLILLIFFCPLAYADWESYAVELEDGSIEIENVDPSADITDVLKIKGIVPKSITQVTAADLPANKSDRKYWTRLGKKIVVDDIKKAEDLAAKQAREARKKQLLKMTDAEYAEAKSLGIVR